MKIRRRVLTLIGVGFDWVRCKTASSPSRSAVFHRLTDRQYSTVTSEGHRNCCRSIRSC